MFENYKLRNYNFKLVILVAILCAIGIVVINSADSSYFSKQVFGVAICMVGMLVLSIIDYRFICKFYIALYAANILMLTAILALGAKVNGAKRWFRVSKTMTIQPSEFTKFLMIICLAVLLVKFKEKLNTPYALLIIAAYCAFPLLLILIQPDLSTTIDIFAILFTMIFVAGLSYKILGVAILILIPVIGSFVWYVQTPGQKLLNDYQLGRIMAFLYPQDYAAQTYQQDNSVMAIGSGMLTGKGLSSGTIATVKDANFISEQQTDFIFSVVGEEMGFVGCIIIIALIALVVFECISIARKARDKEGMLIASGVAAWMGFQSFINIAVATGLIPNTGIPLPFISYGLSSLVSSCAGIGLVLNVSLQRKRL